MKRFLIFYLVALASLFGTPVFADVNNFYFSDFTGDYYLSKDADGLSRLKVVESVTAVFPDYNQNKGICRQIAFTNQAGKNITLPSLTKSNITITRNGLPENIYSIDKGDGYYSVCTGTEEYVLGEQTYVFTYEFTKVVTEFSEDGKEWQELYWDTNGNGAIQKFESVTARVHFSDPEMFTGEKWCYVGKYGDSGQERCEISEISDGVKFVAKDLASNENLTFDVELKVGSFTVPELEKNYICVWLTVLLAAICLAGIGFTYKRNSKAREKAEYYEALFVKPEYQPSKEYSLPEMAEVYIGKKKDTKVAMLLEMVVHKVITLKKGEGRKWSIILNEQMFDTEYTDLLTILNGGLKPKMGDEIEVKRRSANSTLITRKNTMEKKILNRMKEDGLVEKGFQVGNDNSQGMLSIIILLVFFWPFAFGIIATIVGILNDVVGLDGQYGGDFVFREYFYPTAIIMIIATIAVITHIHNKYKKYKKHTTDGLKASRYMDGLKLYIEMAEADRLKMLQSVEGADTSPEGIVKLYENLLPYAAIFGLEKSWMEEMKQYCEVQEIEEPDYFLSGFAISDIARSINNAATIVNNSTVMASSGGSSSSGFSGGGGGGGGFSGGGGGGGGFSGR